MTGRPSTAGTRFLFSSDYFLEAHHDRLRLYALLRRGDRPLLGEIGVADYRNGRWSSLRSILRPSARTWEDMDLGEPAVIRLPDGRELMFYTATSSRGAVRTIGLARRRGRTWVRCGSRPVIGLGAPWGPASSIDPTVAVREGILYVFYGGTRRAELASNLGGAIGVRRYRLPSR